MIHWDMICGMQLNSQIILDGECNLPGWEIYLLKFLCRFVSALYDYPRAT